MIVKLQIIIVGFLFTFFQSYGQQDKPKFDTLKCKMKLTQYLLTTHSVAFTALTEGDAQAKQIFRMKALKYLENASTYYSDLKKNTKIDATLDVELTNTIKAYTEILRDSQNLSKPETGFALQMLESVYKLKILPKLWMTK